MALYFWNNGISLSSINQIQGFNPIVEVVIIAVLHCFLIETEDEDIFERIYKLIRTHIGAHIVAEHSFAFKVFFTLIDEFNIPHGNGLMSGPANVRSYGNSIPIYERITKAVNQLSTMIGLSGFLNADSPQLVEVPQEQRQELINLLQDTSKNVRIYAKIEDGPEPPPSAQVMSMIGSHDDKSLVVKNAEAIERIRSKMAASRYSRRGGKRRKSSNQTQRRKKQHKKTVKRRS